MDRHGDRPVGVERRITDGDTPLTGPYQGFQVERVSATGPVKLFPPGTAQTFRHDVAGIGLAQRREFQQLGHPVGRGAGQCVPQPQRRLPGPARQCQDHPRLGRVAQKMVEQLDRTLVRPMQIVEDEHQPGRLGDQLQQRPNRPVQPVPLRVDQVGGTGGGNRREHGREKCDLLLPEGSETLRAQLGELVVECGDEHTERDVGLELRRACAAYRPSCCVRELPQLRQQPTLADPRFAGDRDAPGATFARQQRTQDRDFSRPAEKSADRLPICFVSHAGVDSLSVRDQGMVSTLTRPRLA